MTSTILRNPYAAILRAIWSIIIDVAQSTANTLGICQLSPFTKTSQHENNITPDSGAANPLGLLLHLKCRGGVVMARTSWKQSYFKIVRVPLVELLHLGGTELKLYIFLLDLADDQPELVDDEWYWKPFNLNEVLGISKKTFARAGSNLKKYGLVDTQTAIYMRNRDGKLSVLVGTPSGKVEVTKEDCWQPSSVEKIVRDRLMLVIGGQPEVSTPVGRIDLLTDSEIIEVKHVADWKSAMGQVLAYASFYPQHTKRIHLFGLVAPSADALAICSQMRIAVTFEEVSNE